MDKLLREAIADAKAVRETALANAKAALQESFTPKLKSMLAAKINEDEDEEVKDLEEKESEIDAVEDETDNKSEAKGDDEEEVEIDEVSDEEENDEEEVDETKSEDDEEEMDEDLDLESIIAELENEAKEEDEDDEEDLDETKDADEDDEAKYEAKDKDEDEVDIDELLAELENEGKGEEDEEEEEEEVDEAKKEEDEKEMDEVKTQLAETRKVVKYLSKKLNEVNLLNAKLLYSTKLFKKYSMNENQKVKVLESLDRTSSVREVKLVYSALAESFKDANSVTKSKLSEMVGASSKSSGNGTKKAIINESSALADRFMKLAHISKKK